MKKNAEPEGSPAKNTYWDDELDAQLSLGRIFMGQQRYNEAAAHFASLLRVTPTDSNRPLIESAAVGLIQSLLATGRLDEAKHLAEQVKTQFPELADELDTNLRRSPRCGEHGAATVIGGA